MTKRMLVDATHPEETRVAIVDKNRLEDFDFESASKKQLKGNIYLARVVRIEPSLQAAFVEYGGNRHGFLSFTEIHPDYFRIPMSDRAPDEEEGEDDSIPTSTPLPRVEPPFAHTEELPLSPEDPPPILLASPSAPPESAVPAFAYENPADELGLITDFGAAIVEPSFAPQPIETIGGESVDEETEEHFHRQRRPDYRIQEVVKRRQVMLVQVVKEERGNKGAALTTFLSLAGRYCVLMPNTDRGGGVSRKITSHQDRKRMKDILDQLETPEGMAVILRTAGMEQAPPEIQRDLEHLLRLWNTIREQTLASSAPALIYEEANLIKRSIRDLHAADVEEITVAGQAGYLLASEFMRSIMPEDQSKVKLYEDPVPLFFRHNVEKQIDQLYNPVVQLRSGGYIVINPTEALVSIDVNSGRATRERHIESTALKTNLEAAEEVARQLRLRDLAGLVVIDFIDMEDGRNNAAVERRLKESMKADRARLQIGRISPFGLLELSRQRLHPSLTEINFEHCPHCAGVGMIRSVDSAAISILRMIEEDGIRQPGGEMVLHLPTKVALYILNQKRGALHEIEGRYGLQVLLHSDDTLVAPDCRLERVRGASVDPRSRAAVDSDQILAISSAQRAQERAEISDIALPQAEEEAPAPRNDSARREEGTGQGGERPPRRRGRFGRGGRDDPRDTATPRDARPDQSLSGKIETGDSHCESDKNSPEEESDSAADVPGDGRPAGRRRGRRGGRGRRSGTSERNGNGEPADPRLAPAAPRPPLIIEQPHSNYTTAAPALPISIHDLDTTPRDPRPASVSAAPPPSPYEVTNPETDKPKGGWWRRLTGQ